MSRSWPSHLLTLEEWDALPEYPEFKVELAEGVLVMSPKPWPGHQRAGYVLMKRIESQIPSDLMTLYDVDVLLSDPPPTVREPDVMIMRTERFDPRGRITAVDVQLVAEILSDGSRRIDRVLKYSEYAEAGIPQYWIVDPDQPASLLAYVLVDGSYELAGEYSGTSVVDVAGHPVTIDLGDLIDR